MTYKLIRSFYHEGRYSGEPGEVSKKFYDQWSPIYPNKFAVVGLLSNTLKTLSELKADAEEIAKLISEMESKPKKESK